MANARRALRLLDTTRKQYEAVIIESMRSISICGIGADSISRPWQTTSTRKPVVINVKFFFRKALQNTADRLAADGSVLLDKTGTSSIHCRSPGKRSVLLDKTGNTPEHCRSPGCWVCAAGKLTTGKCSVLLGSHPYHSNISADHTGRHRYTITIFWFVY